MGKDKLKKFEGLLKLIGSSPKEDFESKNLKDVSQNIPDDHAGLVGTLVGKIAKLKKDLLNVFKIKQQEHLDIHWRNTQEKNREFASKILEQERRLKKELSSKKNK